MNQKTIFSVIVLLALVIGIVAFGQYSPQMSEDPAPNEATVSLENDQAVRQVVMDFGRQLQQVSLLASTDDRKAAMDAAYAQYVAPELLAEWYPEGADALGRYTSSPWPDSIDIVEVRQTGPNFVVEGNVLEVAQSDEGVVPAAVYPVTLSLEERDGTWMIVKMEKGAYSPLPQQQSLVGFWECLPHKDTEGPQTMECAFGIALDQSDGHMAVDTSLMSTYPVDYAVGTKVRISGIVTPVNQLSSIQKYDIDGIIRATMIEEI
ncbi:hypothetical protein C4568_02780 [Candidatus Parcubacteria bacterium]|nr:MAG: hypothetical protein C4568_02780 [Candidatus Parcubacteria bacterium]